LFLLLGVSQGRQGIDGSDKCGYLGVRQTTTVRIGRGVFFAGDVRRRIKGTFGREVYTL
jgi:hypothetical protein